MGWLTGGGKISVTQYLVTISFIFIKDLVRREGGLVGKAQVGERERH